MKKSLLILTIVLTFSCSSDDVKDSRSLEYYEFTSEDYGKLLNTSNAQSDIVYENQDGQTLTFRLSDHSRKKSTYKKGTYVGTSSIEYFDFDNEKLSFSFLNSPSLSSEIRIEQKRWPQSLDLSVYPHKKTASSFISVIEFPFWNGYYDDFTFHNTIIVNFNLPIISMTLNGKIYNNVRVLQSGKTEILLPNINYPRNVNILYYDQNFGIIGFDDLNGKFWRLQ